MSIITDNETTRLTTLGNQPVVCFVKLLLSRIHTPSTSSQLICQLSAAGEWGRLRGGGGEGKLLFFHTDESVGLKHPVLQRRIAGTGPASP